MITVKAFDKNLQCQDFQYEVGKTYEMPKEDVRICKWGFHASAHCDISETVFYYPKVTENRYCLVDLNVVETHTQKSVGNKITILKELTFKECIKYDKTGEWCCEYAIHIGDINKIQILEEAIIEKDKSGKWIHKFACYAWKANIPKLEDVIIEKDKDGSLCYSFALFIRGANISKLEDAVIEKDVTGEDIFLFAHSVEGANIHKLENAVIKKDKTGYWCKAFLDYIYNADKAKLKKAIEEKRRQHDNRKSF